MFTIGSIYKVIINSGTEEISYYAECLDLGKIYDSITYLFRVVESDVETMSSEQLNLIHKAESTNFIQLVFVTDDYDSIPQKILRYGVYFAPTINVEYQEEDDIISSSIDDMKIQYIKIQDTFENNNEDSVSVQSVSGQPQYEIQQISPTTLDNSTETINFYSEGFDIINQENVKIIDYLNSDKNNIVFKFNDAIILSNRNNLYQHSIRNDSNIVFECYNIDTALVPRTENLNLSEPYFQINALPSYQGGLIKLSELLSIIKLKIRLIHISSIPIHTCVAVTSLNVLRTLNASSSNHCQAETGMNVYKCSIINLPIPTLPNTRNGGKNLKKGKKSKKNKNKKYKTKKYKTKKYEINKK